MSGSQYPNDVQFAGLIQAATAAADAQERNAAILGKRTRSEDDSLIDTQLRAHPAERSQVSGQLPPTTPILQSSASVLFREPSEKSKKYSRPPLGKVYTELELAPESFLRLQNAAKSYMLDENHMERRDVVGHKKHSSNNDVAKLRLWSCVEDFLSRDDNGEKWFGHNAGAGIPGVPERSFLWPDDKSKIIKRCMPLFRKMVTNERQRQYAFETRKQDSSKNDKNKKVDTPAVGPAEHLPLPRMSLNHSSIIDQALDAPNASHGMYSTDHNQHQNVHTIDHLTLFINIISNNNGTTQRLSRFSATSGTLTTLRALVAEAHQRHKFVRSDTNPAEGDWFMPVVKVWLPDGIVRIKDDEQWMVALLSASMVEWMDSEVRVLIEIGSNPEVITV